MKDCEEELNDSLFRNLAGTRERISHWRELNGELPHSSLGYGAPAEFAEALIS